MIDAYRAANRAYRFFFVSFDSGEPPHIHVRRDNMVAKFRLDPVTLERAGGFNRTELSKIAAHVVEHREAFLERWNEFFSD
jgi:hypothetical protein